MGNHEWKYMANHLIILMCLTLVLLSGCSLQPDSYPFENRNEPISSIELLYYPWALDQNETYMEFKLIRSLEADETESFMEELYAIPTARSRPTPNSNYGPYVVRVNYVNGDTEYFGSQHIEFVESGSQPYAVGYYYFQGDAFEELFEIYAQIVK